MAEAKKPAKTTKPAAAKAEAESPAPAATPTPVQPVHTSNKKVFIIVGAVVLVLVIIPGLLFAGGALFVGNKLKDEGVNVNTNSGSVTVKDKNGNEFSAGGSQSMPKDFPAEVTVYKGDIVSSGRLTNDGKTGWTVTISTSDNVTKVGDSLNETFSTNGWTTSMTNQTNDGGLMIATKGDLRANMFYSTQDGKTNILYTVTKENSAQ